MTTNGVRAAKDNEAMVCRSGPLLAVRQTNPVVRLVRSRCAKYVDKLLELHRQHRFLQLGCGQGEMLDRLDAALKVGVDVRPAELAVAQKRLGREARIVEAPFDALPFPDAHFDRILCCGILPQFDRPVSIVEEMRRVLAHNGLAVVMVSHQELFGQVEGFLDRLRLLGYLTTGWLGRFLLPRHIEQVWQREAFTEEQLRQIVQRHFRIQKVQGIPRQSFELAFVAQLVTL